MVWKRPTDDPSRSVAAASESMATRGPDASGTWHDSGASLGHRRLAILDPTHRADQPMGDDQQRFVLVFNGEIYNFRDLRAQLETDGARFATDSDTEVVLKLFEKHGPAMLPLLRGMFALAIWDSWSRRLFIARDPYGVKPLYVAETGVGVVVASQVKAIRSTGLVSVEPDPVGQAGFWLTGSVPEPHTWFRQIQALPAGHLAWADDRGLSTPECWWDIADDWRQAEFVEAPDGDIVSVVRQALKESVSSHLVSDVPIGLFLSGGIDSSVVAGLVSERGSSPLMTGVTVAFEEFAGSSADEAPLAATVARHFGLSHRVRAVSEREFHDDLPDILRHMDQPSVDGVNTWFASKAMAELGLKVVLSGVGGDELFQGYAHFRSLPRLMTAKRLAARLPGGAKAFSLLGELQSRRTGNPRWRRVTDVESDLSISWMARRGLFAWEELPTVMGSELVREAHEAASYMTLHAAALPRESRLAISLLESSFYLRNQLLRDSDWASMAFSVELRTPLVDAWLLRQLTPFAQRFKSYPQKGLLAMAPSAGLPREVKEKRKTGFGVPVDQWLGGGTSGGHPTKAWAKVAATSVDVIG